MVNTTFPPPPKERYLLCENLTLTCIPPENMVTYALRVVIREPQIFKEILSVDDVASDDFRALPKMKLLLVIWGSFQRDS